MPSEDSDPSPPFRQIARHFPEAPDLAPDLDYGRRWRTHRDWAGSPNLEWSFLLFPERVTAFSGKHKAYFYEHVKSFAMAKWILRMNSILLERRIASFPSLTVGFEYFDGAYYVADGHLALPAVNEPFRGRHNVMCLDCADPELISFQSWAPDWGDNGRGYMSRAYFEAHVDCAIIRWYAVGGPSAAWARCLNSTSARRRPKHERPAHCWPVNNDFQVVEIDHNAVTHWVLYWQVLSLQEECWVDVFEIRGGGQVVGRAHLYHGEDRSSLRELFVLPAARRQGYGTWLLDLAVQRLPVYGNGNLEIWLYEDDAQPGAKESGWAFGLARGFSWQEVQMRRPNVVAIAAKQVDVGGSL